MATYIAHPLNAPSRAGIDANRANAAKWAAWYAGVTRSPVICDWIVLSGEWEETPENRELGLVLDLALIDRADRVLLTGGRISSGMKLECEHAFKGGKLVLDATEFGYEAPNPGACVACGRVLRVMSGAFCPDLDCIGRRQYGFRRLRPDWTHYVD